MNESFARRFANEWMTSWNAHDLDAVLEHYDEEVVIETPMAQSLVPESNGVVSGKKALRAYWTIGLERIPNLRFELLDVLTGINGLTMYYLNAATGKKSAESVFFNEAGKVIRTVVHYS